MKIDPNAPAFPVKGTVQGSPYSTDGLTIRAEIASRLMAGLLANTQAWEEMSSDSFVNGSVEFADRLIARLNREVTP